MAEVSQNIIPFDKDSFTLRYTFLDDWIDGDTIILPSATFEITNDWGFFWSAGLNSDWPTIPTMIRSKATVGWSYAITFTPNNYAIYPAVGSNYIDILFNQSDFGTGKLETNTEYYTELVAADKANQENSIVVATGLFYVSQSMFTEEGYR